MSALAQLLAGEGVSGSDRAWPGDDPHFTKLQKQGVALFPQDGSGITPSTGRVIVSTAIEKNNPDLLQAHLLKKPLVHRSTLLAEMANARQGVAVSGTSGKSTICGMIGVLFEETGLSPSIVNGGEVKNFISETAIGNSEFNAAYKRIDTRICVQRFHGNIGSKGVKLQTVQRLHFAHEDSFCFRFEGEFEGEMVSS